MTVALALAALVACSPPAEKSNAVAEAAFAANPAPAYAAPIDGAQITSATGTPQVMQSISYISKATAAEILAHHKAKLTEGGFAIDAEMQVDAGGFINATGPENSVTISVNTQEGAGAQDVSIVIGPKLQ
jgi:hypothetical protein